MREREFYDMVDKNRIQIFLFESNCPFPFILFTYTWFLVSNHGVIDRWEAGTPIALNAEN
jgi:hypothetical protein